MLSRPRHRASGFTMIELVVTIAIFAILVALTVPAMQVWIANTKVRAVADALQNGVRLAQAEALRRSRQVVFALTNNSNPPPGFAAVANGTYWAIQTIPIMTDGSELPAIVSTGVLTSVGSNVTITSTFAAICFNSMGRLVANTAANTGVGAACAVPTAGVNSSTVPTLNYAINLTKANGTALADTPLQVEVALGGQVHLCNPTTSLSSSNPYGC